MESERGAVGQVREEGEELTLVFFVGGGLARDGSGQEKRSEKRNKQIGQENPTGKTCKAGEYICMLLKVGLQPPRKGGRYLSVHVRGTYLKPVCRAEQME